MDASEFKNYILGVIFYRYLSERTEMYMTDLLKNDDGITYEEAFADDEYRPVVEEWSLSKLGYVIKPENLFRNLIRKITKFENDADKFNVEDFEKAINDLVGSTMGYESNKAFDGLFNDMRLQDSRRMQERKAANFLRQQARRSSVQHLRHWGWMKQRRLVTVLVVLRLCFWKYRNI